MDTYNNITKSGIYGVCVGDAVGVPAEFKSREELRKNPVTNMTEGGVHGQPKGTWSDDSSMTLALAYSIGETRGIHTHDIMERFLAWFREGCYSPLGECFDIGHTTVQALLRYEAGITPALCGGNKLNCNGNGSLMRILPLVFALYPVYGADFTVYGGAMEWIHKISGLTHRHKLAQSACGIYANIAARLIDGMEPEAAVKDGIEKSLAWYWSHESFDGVDRYWQRITDVDALRALLEEEIKSGGYVVETLEASLWCLLNTGDYESCILKAVNLGEDTDTTGAVAGGLAGLAYGIEGIPESWLENLAGRKLIDTCCESLAAYMGTLQRVVPDKKHRKL